jgi:hypothetical protein
MARLEEIRDEMLSLLEEAKQIVRSKKKTNRMTYERMMAYWYPHIQMALTSEHDFCGSDTNMQEAIDELEGADSLEALLEYAEEASIDDARALELAKELDIDPQDVTTGRLTIRGVIEYELENASDPADGIREAIDSLEGSVEEAA